MLNEIGHSSLFLALAAAICQATAPLWGATHRVGVLAARIQLLFVSIAWLALTAAFLRLDFSLALVAQNAHSALPSFYRLGAVWGNHEGSLLLWVLVLAVFSAALAHTPKANPAFIARALAAQGVLSVGFLGLSLFTANPFLRLLPPPIDGADLNPILQDPALMFHPPLLYLGYVGFSTCWSITMAALWRGGLTMEVARVLRVWALFAWSILGLGIALGSWWAYYELGWGGFWFWDPVENAALMPWLAGTALIHCLRLSATEGSFKNWSALLAVITFSLSLLGAFLVRSGILDSVHSFAADPLRGLAILGLITLLGGGGFYLYLKKADPKEGQRLKPASRQSALMFNNLLVLTFAATVFLGTIYPIIIKAAGLEAVTVGAPYFNLMGAALLIPMAVGLVALPGLVWGRSPRRKELIAPMAAAAAGGILTAWAIWLFLGNFMLLPMLLLALLAAAFLATLRGYLAGKKGRARLSFSAHGMSLSHMGFCLLLLAAITADFGKSELPLYQEPGQKVVLASTPMTFLGEEKISGANYGGFRGAYKVGERVIFAENRFYPAAKVATVEAAIRVGWFGNHFITLAQGEGRASRVVFQPLVIWLWVGAGLVVAGGFVTAVGGWRRLRGPRVRATKR